MTAFVGASLTETYTAAQRTGSEAGKSFGLGDRYEDSTGKAWVYVTASAAVAQYDVVFLTTAFAVTTLSTANDARGNLAAVAPVAFASGDYGWVQVRGPSTLNVLASCAANVRLNTTATAGSLDDDGTVGAMQVQGIYLTTARAASNGSAPGILNNPFIDATL